MVERLLPKEKAAGSNPVSRSNPKLLLLLFKIVYNKLAILVRRWQVRSSDIERLT